MKTRYLSPGFLFLLLLGCTYHDLSLSKVDCLQTIETPPAVTCSGSICESDTCTNYLGVWKELFLTKNQMTQQYYNDHISLCKLETFHYANQGIQFEITYKFSIDWFETTFEEGFMIWLDPAYLQANPTVNLPSETLLSKVQINDNISNSFFGYAINTITPIDHLKYASRQDAINAMALAAGVNGMCVSALSIQYQNVSNLPLGHPLLQASAVLSSGENRCVSGTMDLSTDFIQTNKEACIIEFCFTRGTQIIVRHDLTQPIEKIKLKDKILSLNLNTMNFDMDVVEQIDSVKHHDMVRISFNDRTINENTSDHPYYVKNKGWCSYKPHLTLQKYGIETKQLMIGDVCLKYKKGKLMEIPIRKIIEIPGEVMTYNISRLKINKTYFANGILVSNEQNSLLNQ